MEAKRELQVIVGLFIAKLVLLAVCTLMGPEVLALGVLGYVAITVLTALVMKARSMQGCRGFLFIPILLVGGPALTYVGRIAVAVWPLAVLLCILAVLYDIGLIRRCVSQYRTTSEKAKVAGD